MLPFFRFRKLAFRSLPWVTEWQDLGLNSGLRDLKSIGFMENMEAVP